MIAFGLVATGLLAAVLVIRRALHQRSVALSRQYLKREYGWRPQELRRAPVVYAEAMFRTTEPCAIVARVDRAFELRGEIVLVEFKTRTTGRVYPSDVIELSAQRVALQRETGRTVRRAAYVVVESPASGERHAYPASLLSEDAVCEIARRRRAVLTGKVTPDETRYPGLCRDCGYVAECQPKGWVPRAPIPCPHRTRVREHR